MKTKISSLFTNSCEVTTTKPQNSVHSVEEVGRLDKFLQKDCKPGNITLDEARYFFCLMIPVQPKPPISSFNWLFGALAKKKFYEDVILFYKQVGSMGLLTDLITLNILINCLCNVGRACDGFVVFGRILRWTFDPNAVTFNALIKGFDTNAVTFNVFIKSLCLENSVTEAIQKLKKMVVFAVRPYVITYGTLINGLCRTGNWSVR
ncbi:pentatricopeptide repeat-containing protein At1g62670, mitochondrial-like isoform X3 [Pistacia vera]|uniref:pentatricopeptide repeat-containing protein At1g62670, mitochondrial-like isoform X2 n=1 Tax=Pistacia vera TaxID=55513 RepID=UPI001263297D|nr:pentatricopeptide repeat-containing protein At1g62670, mitochondrial-like isoform X2 [Pistacia vera]XP_031254469.1 pentatricopeptide repeat-containing protein At1g62670, mitochondrial-like isoform X3 [Pistacia vera]